MLGAPQAAANAAPPPLPAVGSWVQYLWKVPKKPESRIRFAVVAGDASGRRRFEIEVVERGRLARFGYDLAADGTRSRHVAQLGKNGAAILIDDSEAVLPEPPKIDAPKKANAKELVGFRTIKVPAGTFRCKVLRNVQGEACIDAGLMPLNIVKFEGESQGSMTLIGRGFDAKPRILAKPRRLPVFNTDKLPKFP